MHLPECGRLSTWRLLALRYLGHLLFLTLRHCYISVTDERLKCIATYCATLEDLAIACSSITADELFLLIQRLLATLSCPALDLAAWEHLSNHPTFLIVVINKESIVFPIWPPQVGTLMSFYADMAPPSRHSRISLA